MTELLHASAVAIGAQAVLLTGPSGAGKSDLALRLIDRGATLIGDDAVHLSDGYVSGPAHLRGQLEVRGLGIITVPSAPERVELSLHIELVPRDGVARMPELRIGPFGVSVLQMHAFDQSAPIRAEAALARIRPLKRAAQQ
ncbi:MAG: HPr kinase/phosphatase C-terminal domain-containing protein [Pseudomonadota bacterium]